jgi:hypothetical protein
VTSKGGFQRYRRALTVYLGVNVLIAGLCLYGIVASPDDVFDATPLIPLKNQFYEILLNFYIIPVTATTGALIGGYLLAPVYLLFHKTAYRKMRYGIQETPPPKTFKNAFLGYYPTLLAYNIGSILVISSPSILRRVLSPYMISEIPLTLQYISGNFILMMFTIGIGMLVFSPGWFLIDAGIVYSTRDHVEGTGRPVEGRTVGGWFNDYLKGYSGFGVAFSYLQIVFMFYNRIGGPFRTNIANLVGWFGLPFYVMLTLIPGLILLDMIREHRVRFIRNMAARLGVTAVVEISFE